MNDDLLTVYAHNEYLQMAAELGAIGLLIFVLFSVTLVVKAGAALKRGGRHFQILGASGALLAFALSSGASASSFRYLSGGLIFFFAAALICRHAGETLSIEKC
jgi:O-antigen ligase